MATPPTHVGPYRVVRELGRGGMGVVWEVRHPSLDRPLALKQVLGDAADAEALARFRREAEALARLRHPGVVVVHELGATEVGPYLVTDLVQGRDLKELGRGGPLDPRRAAELVAGVADAVAAVHGHGLLHRDLKPGNVIVQERDGRPVLLDFGLARELDRSSLTASGMVVGTPGFMAPEQLEGRRDLDARADVYGLGAILFFLLAGRAPFEGALVNVVTQALTRDPVWPEGAPGPLVAILRQAMARERDGRYATAGALADDLRRFLAGEAPLAAPPRRGRGTGVAAFAGLAALAGLAAAVALAASRRQPGPLVEPRAPTEAAPAPREATEETPEALAASRLRTLERSPSGALRLEAWLKLVAFAKGRPAAERAALEAGFAPLRKVPLWTGAAPEGATQARVGFSRGAPEQQRLAFGWPVFAEGRALHLDTVAVAPFTTGIGLRALASCGWSGGHVLISDRGHLATLAPGGAEPVVRWTLPDPTPGGTGGLFAVATAPSGEVLAVGGRRSTVWILGAGQFEVRERLDSGIADDVAVDGLAFSHDSKRLVVVRTESLRGGRRRGRVDVWDLEARAREPAWRPVPELDVRPRCAAFARDGSLVVGFDGGLVQRYRAGASQGVNPLPGREGLGADVVALRVDRAGNPIVATGVPGGAGSGNLAAVGLPGTRGTLELVKGGVGLSGLDLSFDEHLVVTGDLDGIVQVWGWRLAPSTDGAAPGR